MATAPRPRTDRCPTRGSREPEAGGTSRRAFLTAGGIAAAGVIVGGVAGGVIGHQSGVNDTRADPGDDSPRPDPGAATGFEHVVVVMGENRSFDHMLGLLYTPDDRRRARPSTASPTATTPTRRVDG